jgi:hypothetical protein
MRALRIDGFGRSLLFAALAAAAWPAFALLAGPGLGAERALRLYVVSAGALYAALLAPSAAAGARAGLVALAIGSGTALLDRSVAGAAAGAALALAVCRGAILFRRRPARHLALELALGAGGLALARAAAAPTVAGAALGIWAFGLAQSAWFLVAGAERRPPDAAGVDPFEDARKRALALLDGDA